MKDWLTFLIDAVCRGQVFEMAACPVGRGKKLLSFMDNAISHAASTDHDIVAYLFRGP
jgi:hypothetical protein